MPSEPSSRSSAAIPTYDGGAPIDEGRRELDVRVGLGMFASEAQLEQLLAISRPVDVAAGHVLHAGDSPPTTIFQIISGEIELRAPDMPTWQVAAGGTVGFLDFMRGRRHSRTAVAITAASVLELDTTRYREYLEDNFEVGYRIMSQLSGAIMSGAISSPEAKELLSSVAVPHPGSLAKVEVPMVERLMILSRMPAFAGATTQALANLARSTIETRFEPGQVVAAAGSSSSIVSLLVEGAVELELPNGLRVPRAGRGFLAHLEELTLTPRLSAVTASSALIVLEIEREELLDLLEEHFDLVMTILGSIAGELEKLNDVEAANATGLGTDWK